jgi:adenylate kinase family enzyme
MDLVFIYGPPATGKLTVAQELEKLTGYTIFHNHISDDLALMFFARGTDPYSELSMKVRMDILESLVKNGVDTIFTSAFIKGYTPAAMRLVEGLVAMVEHHGGKVCFVHLTARTEELLRRVDQDSRKGFGKITTQGELSKHLSTRGEPKEPPIKGSFAVDNTNKSAAEVAAAITEHFGLRMKQRQYA